MRAVIHFDLNEAMREKMWTLYEFCISMFTYQMNNNLQMTNSNI